MRSIINAICAAALLLPAGAMAQQGRWYKFMSPNSSTYVDSELIIRDGHRITTVQYIRFHHGPVNLGYAFITYDCRANSYSFIRQWQYAPQGGLPNVYKEQANLPIAGSMAHTLIHDFVCRGNSAPTVSRHHDPRNDPER